VQFHFNKKRVTQNICSQKMSTNTLPKKINDTVMSWMLFSTFTVLCKCLCMLIEC
jgi:hypothetical protein